MCNRKIWIPLVPSGFYWLCNWINCVLVEYQSKQVNCFLSDGNKNFLLDCRGYKRPPPVKNSFALGNYFVQCNGFFFFLFRIFISKIKHKLFSWSQKSKIFTWITFYKDEQGKSKQKKRYVFHTFSFLSFLRNIDISRNPRSAVCIAKVLLCYAYLGLFQAGSKGGKYSGLNNAEICKVNWQSISDAKKKIMKGWENSNGEQL